MLTFSACLFSTLPFGWLVPQAFGRNGLARLLEQIAAGRVFINTLLPALITATLQVLSAYLAALSIGAIQPLGKRSKWLLLLFSPWLFVTVLPLSPANFMAYQNAGRLEPFLGSLSPILFSIPALFILTIFFNGRASHLQRKITDGGSAEPSNFFKHFVLPSLPLAAVLWLLILFFNGQDVFWPLLVSVSPERYPLSITLLRLAGMLNLADGTLAAAITFFVLPVCFLFLVSLIPFQIFYLDRLSLFTEDLAAEKSEHL
jgi:ABC-type maltose transport system permease subunit